MEQSVCNSPLQGRNSLVLKWRWLEKMTAHLCPVRRASDPAAWPMARSNHAASLLKTIQSPHHARLQFPLAFAICLCASVLESCATPPLHLFFAPLHPQLPFNDQWHPSLALSYDISPLSTAPVNLLLGPRLYTNQGSLRGFKSAQYGGDRLNYSRWPWPL